MSDIKQEYSKATLPDNELGNVLGTGSGINTGQEGVEYGTPGTAGSGKDGFGNTFLTEPLHAEFVKLLEEASFVRQIAKMVPMTQPTLRVPAITEGLEVFYQGEQGQEAQQTVMSAGDFTLEARKIMAQVLATAELYEDSQQNIESIITGDFVRAIAQAEEQAFLLGRMTKAGTPAKGSIVDKTPTDATSDGAGNIANIANLTQFVRGGTNFTPGTGKFGYSHYGTQTGSWTTASSLNLSSIASSPLNICDGVVTVATDEGNVIDMGGASFRGGTAYKAIREAIFKLGLLGRDRGQLVLVLNPVASNQLLQSDELMTLDKYGSNATILTGEVGSLFGVKILESSFIPSEPIKTYNVDGVTQNGTWGKGGYGVLIHTPSLLLGDLRKVQVENERVIQNDAFRTVISERLAFGVQRRNCAVAIGGISTDVTSLSSGTSVFIPGGLVPTLAGNDTIQFLSNALTTTATATITAGSLDVGETYQITSPAWTATVGNPGLTDIKIDVASGDGLADNVSDLVSGETNSMGVSSASQTTLTVTATIQNTALDNDDVITVKLALFDGSSYSNVHTIQVKAVAS